MSLTMHSETFLRGLQRQLAIVCALVIREMTTRYGNKIGGYLWAILDPVATVLILTLVFSSVAQTPPLGRDFTLFFATGYAIFYMYRSMADQVCSAVQANQALLNYPIVTPFDTIYARIVLQVATLFVVNIVLFGAIYLSHPFGRLGLYPVLCASAVAILLGAGVGAANIVWFNLSSTYQQVWGIINRPAFILSGVFFLPESLPHPFRDIILLNPIVHIIGLFRTGFYPTYRAGYVDMGYVLSLAVFSLIFGLSLVWLFDARLREPK